MDPLKPCSVETRGSFGTARYQGKAAQPGLSLEDSSPSRRTLSTAVLSMGCNSRRLAAAKNCLNRRRACQQSSHVAIKRCTTSEPSHGPSQRLLTWRMNDSRSRTGDPEDVLHETRARTRQEVRAVGFTVTCQLFKCWIVCPRGVSVCDCPPLFGSRHRFILPWPSLSPRCPKRSPTATVRSPCP